ncbi:MAG: hypothetical protein COX57_10205 [Alphaproteobacteria bacterium CG_4_10_14_0_2_um_filter_63_37]|nr:MAG: hypothetical protein AUJ55_04230 [Proteobacteria bacterium CG1_02_64_396]PJA24152.1 MAG: hypothetical protein COX57_10205 [Alphaproteobacteria bacterium CG_4_10_14_0_2_um_filter_63_37]
MRIERRLERSIHRALYRYFGDLSQADERLLVLTRLATGLGIVLFLSFGAFYLSQGLVLLGLLKLSVALVLALNLRLLRGKEDLLAVSNRTLLVLLAFFLFLLLNGGYQDTAPVWLAGVILACFALQGMARGIVWTLAFLAAQVAVALAQWGGWMHSPFPLPTLLYLIGAQFSLAFLVVLYEGLRSHGDWLHKRQSWELTRLNRRLSRTLHAQKQTEAELLDTQEKLRHQAHFDHLTHLPNRVLLYDRLHQAVKQARRGKHQLAVLYIDLNEFKRINDSLGHQAGDWVLREAARRLRRTLRDSDTVGRTGGDEFIVLIPRIAHIDDALIVADKILDEFQRPFPLPSGDRPVGISIGISLFPDHGHDEDLLLAAADKAMYAVKRSGNSGRLLYTPDPRFTPQTSSTLQ